jgi:hypothetical protein
MIDDINFEKLEKETEKRLRKDMKESAKTVQGFTNDYIVKDLKTKIKCTVAVKNNVIYKVRPFTDASKKSEKGNTLFEPTKMNSRDKLQFKDMVRRFKKINESGVLLRTIKELDRKAPKKLTEETRMPEKSVKGFVVSLTHTNYGDLKLQEIDNE